MAQSQIRQPSQEELIRAFSAGNTPFDPTLAGRGIAAGEDLASTILKNKQGQEDRVRQLAEKIAQAKKEQTFVQGIQKGPVVSSIIGKPITASETIQGVQPEDKQLGEIAAAYPKEVAGEKLKEILLNKSEAGKLERARLRNEQKSTQPDRIKQLFQLGDKTVGVTYGGEVKPISVPGDANLNPLKKTLPADIAQQLGDFNTLSDQINTVKSTYKKDFVGPVQARTGELAQTFDIPQLGLEASPQRADFYANVNSIRNQLLYLRSGKQINEKEYERLVAELPNEKRSDVDFEAKLKNFEKFFNEIKTNRQSALATGYQIPGNGGQTPPAGNPGKKTGFRVISVRPSGSQ
jgi:hypothetical protein